MHLAGYIVYIFSIINQKFIEFSKNFWFSRVDSCTTNNVDIFLSFNIWFDNFHWKFWYLMSINVQVLMSTERSSPRGRRCALRIERERRPTHSDQAFSFRTRPWRRAWVRHYFCQSRQGERVRRLCRWKWRALVHRACKRYNRVSNLRMMFLQRCSITKSVFFRLILDFLSSLLNYSRILSNDNHSKLYQ